MDVGRVREDLLRTAIRSTHVYDQGPERFTSKERDAETGLDYFGARYFSAAGQPGAPDAFPAIQVVVDKSNTNDMGMDPAKVLAHELGGHTSNVLDLAGRDPNNPSITELDRARDEADSRKAENVGKLPATPTPADVKKIEEILKERNP